MKNSTVKKMSDLLQNSALTRIVRQANELNLLNDSIQPLLPEVYRGLYRIVDLSDNQLTFEVQSPVVRQGLLMQQAWLLSLIQAKCPQITELKFNLNPQFKRI